MTAQAQSDLRLAQPGPRVALSQRAGHLPERTRGPDRDLLGLPLPAHDRSALPLVSGAEPAAASPRAERLRRPLHPRAGRQGAIARGPSVPADTTKCLTHEWAGKPTVSPPGRSYRRRCGVLPRVLPLTRSRGHRCWPCSLSGRSDLRHWGRCRDGPGAFPSCA